MVNVCPKEGDPRETVSEFISNDSVRVMSGLRVQGVAPMMDVIKAEIMKQTPKTNILILDRDALCGVTFPRELVDLLRKELVRDEKNAVIIPEDPAISNWQFSFQPLIDEGYKIQVYYGTSACRQVPMCTKLF
jgi:hypothetical protein